MTSDAWTSCEDPTEALALLDEGASDRKLRLFACAYARTGSWLKRFADACFANFYSGWGKQRSEIDLHAAQAELLALRKTPPGSFVPLRLDGEIPAGALGVAAIEAGEAIADGGWKVDDFASLRHELERKLASARTGTAYCGPSADRPAEEFAMLSAALEPTGRRAAEMAVAAAVHYFVAVADSGPRRQLNAEFRKPLQRQTARLQVELLREIFGDPFRPLRFDASRLDALVRDGAASIDRRRAYDELPILVDALVDAGCVPDEIVDHLTQPRPHVRGCWALDLIAGKS